MYCVWDYLSALAPQCTYEFARAHTLASVSDVRCNFASRAVVYAIPLTVCAFLVVYQDVITGISCYNLLRKNTIKLYRHYCFKGW